MPDIDIDMCQDRRQEIIEYVRKKYGQVAQIITFGTMKAKAVIRDVCRVLAVPLAEADRLAKLVPFALDMTLDKALETEPELKQAYDTNELTRKVIDIGRKLEGLARHASVHAAGVVIADEPLTNFVPLYKAPGTEDVTTQYEGPIVEKVGLLKMDFLGLKTLSVLERARQLVKQNHGVELDLEKLDITDPQDLQRSSRRRDQGRLPVRIGRDAGPADEDEAGPHRGPDRRQRPLPARPDDPDPRLHRPQARPPSGPCRTRS